MALAQAGFRCAQFNSAALEQFRDLAFDGRAYTILLPSVLCSSERVRIHNCTRTRLVGRGAVRVSLQRKAVFPVFGVNDVMVGFWLGTLPFVRFPRQDALVGRLAVGSRLTVAGLASEFPFRPWMGHPLQESMPRASLCANRPARTPETGHLGWYPGRCRQASGWVGEFLSECRNGGSLMQFWWWVRATRADLTRISEWLINWKAC